MEPGKPTDEQLRGTFPQHPERYGTSVLGQPLEVWLPGGQGGGGAGGAAETRVLVFAGIHGEEPETTVALSRALRSLGGVPPGAAVVLAANPDGLTRGTRGNANGVDLNRNFPYKWGPIGVPGDSQYAGIGPASEPETQAITNFMTQLRPDITIWYHQDLFVVNPSQGREGRVRERYAQLTGLPMGQITGGTYTGIAATWARNEFRPDDGVAFIVELGPTLSPIEAIVHADAVRTIAVEG